MRWTLPLLALLWAGFAQVLAQDVPEAPDMVKIDKGVERLKTLMPELEAAKTTFREKSEALAEATNEEEIKALQEEVATQRERVNQMRENFRTIATGVDGSIYSSQAENSVSWQQNLEDIIAPISREVREMTEGPREMEELRNELSLWEKRKRLAEAALARIDEFSGQVESEAIREELETARELWANRQGAALSETEVLKQQIEEREANRQTTWERVSGFLADFWRSRGLNLLLAVVLAVLVFWGSRKTHRMFRRVSPLHRKGGNNLAARSADLAWLLGSIVLSVVAVVVVFYVRGDWLLLALSIVAILGVLWASKRALPPYLEQMRLILNLGPVRQGERLVFEGVPWRVDRLNFYCEFSNPELAGAVLRLPVRDVMPLHSRPAPAKEPWFPTHLDDWVLLGDGTYGKVIQQSPEQVVVLRLGGSLKTYPTTDFLGESPENLSRGFRVSATFGIDYQHQAECTEAVPEIFQLALERELIEKFDRDHVRSVKVEFASAGASSLDYAILADFSGELASRKNVIERLLQRVCVDVCNERGWVIPFTQVTVHQA